MNRLRKSASLLALIMGIGLSSPASAQTTLAKQGFEPFLTRGKTTWSVGTGVRVDNFDWNIASDITGQATPNILSELTWRDITLLEVTGGVVHEEPVDLSVINGDLHLEATLTLGMPIAGENQDSDYNEDNRMDEFSRTLADSDGGYAAGISAAVGYKFFLTGDPQKRAQKILRSKTPRTAKGKARRMRALQEAMNKATPTVTVMPLIGYAVDQQKYTMTNVNQIIPAIGPVGPTDFDWHYQANWYGPFVGLEGEVRGQKNMLRLRGQYHDLDFYGEGYWRGRAAFRQDPSYTQEADADGFLFNAEYAYALGDDYALTVDATYMQRSGEDGYDKTFFADNTESIQKFNEVNNESYGMQVGLRYNW
ncbi:MAG: hypothetical protein H6867_06610 [Rhodospirillales bacterium]|nr:hypothetical protein [Rhodospirillales bacterium]MCB9995220.1 hypothetical protein [Rhodospirillales bacterium]